VIRLIIADAHVGQRPNDAADMAGLVLRAADAGVGEIVYLGDSFQYLIGMEKFWTSGIRRVVTAWQRARSRGVRIVLLEGNRDFFLDEPELAERIDSAGRQLEFASGGRRFRAVHGDKVNLRDFQYVFWSAVSKSSPARLWARLLPRSMAVAIVTHMEARLAETNRKFRYRKPVRELRRAAEKAWSEGIDVLLWGHFHTHWEHREGDKIAMVVPAWLETRCAVLVPSTGDWRWVDADLETATRGPSEDRSTGVEP
jgi:UDP-2,3-diacylglucosamine pyrophosphatase LpxH